MTDADGSVNGVYAVNIFGSGDITDHGSYDSVKMLNTNDKITQDGDKISFSTNAEKAYMQGTLKGAEIPWDISIKYFLDGKEYTPNDIAGKSGKLEIKLKISKNENCKSDFYENYALQASFALDTELCSNIKADGATTANVGSDKQISYTILPNKGIDASITADVRDFEMDAVSINGVKLNLDIDIDISEISDEVAELNDGVTKIDDGANSVSDGSDKLKDGGAKTLDSGITAYTQGVDKICSGYSQIASGVSDLATGSKSLVSGSQSVDKGVSDLYDGIVNLCDGTKELSDGTGELKDRTSGMDDEINIKIDDVISEMKGGDGEVTSFVSDKNTDVESVQFVIKTDAIEIPEAEEEEQPAQEELTFWQKLVCTDKKQQAYTQENECVCLLCIF